MSTTPSATTNKRGLSRLVGWSQHPSILLAMMGQTFINMLGVGIVGPVLPLYAQSFGVGATMVGLLTAIFGIARIPVNVPAGTLAERIGRKPLLVIGPLIMGLASGLTGLAANFGQLLALRCLQGIGSGLQVTAAMIVMADISTPQDRGRTMSLYQGALLLGTSVGPMIGGFVGEWLGYRAPFFVYAGLTLCSATWAYFAVSETRDLSNPTTAPAAEHATAERDAPEQAVAKPRSRLAALRALLDPNFLLFGLVTLSIFFTRSGSQNTVLPLFGSARLKIGPAKLGYGFTSIALLNLLTINTAGVVCDRFGRKVVIVPSCLLIGVAIASFTLGTTYLHFLLSCMLLGVATGIGGPAPAAYVSDLNLPGGRGLSMGVFRTMGDIGMAIGPVLLGWISDRLGYDAALYTNAALLFITTAAFGLLARETGGRRVAARCEAIEG